MIRGIADLASGIESDAALLVSIAVHACEMARVGRLYGSMADSTSRNGRAPRIT